MKIDVYTSKFINNRFSKIALLLFALVFAAVGTYIVISGLAATNFIVTPGATTSLAVPKVSYPPDGSILTAKRPQLVWASVTGANAYRVRLYQDDNLIIDDLARTNTYTPFFDLADKGNFYWSVQALNAVIASTPTSAVELAAKRTTQPTMLPAAPTLIAPTNGIHTTATSVTVSWNAITGASSPVTYIAQYAGTAAFSADGSFSSPWYTAPATTARSVAFSGLTPNVYYWHVKAVDGLGRSGAWSATRSYTVDLPATVAAPAPVVDTNVTISALSTATYLYNFSVDYTRATNYLMPSPAVNWIGAFVSTTGDPNAAFSSFELSTGKKHQVANRFKSFYWDSKFPLAEAQSFYNSSRHYILTWEPFNPGLGAAQAQFSNAAITNNQTFTNYAGTATRFDDYITSYAQSIKAYKRPVYLRFAHEMNGNWYPWGATNGNTAASYVAMWKHVHNIFDQNGVKNVRWIWCVNNDPASAVMGYYPGDAYVDIVAMDGYNWGNTQTWSRWTEFQSIFDGTYAALTALTKKDIWIVETGSRESGGSKAAWITNAYNYAKVSYPRVRAMMWFNADDWLVNTSTTALTSYKAAVTNY